MEKLKRYIIFIIGLYITRRRSRQEDSLLHKVNRDFGAHGQGALRVHMTGSVVQQGRFFIWQDDFLDDLLHSQCLVCDDAAVCRVVVGRFFTVCKGSQEDPGAVPEFSGEGQGCQAAIQTVRPFADVF